MRLPTVYRIPAWAAMHRHEILTCVQVIALLLTAMAITPAIGLAECAGH